jgi:hypothetical protein
MTKQRYVADAVSEVTALHRGAKLDWCPACGREAKTANKKSTSYNELEQQFDPVGGWCGGRKRQGTGTAMMKDLTTI